MDTETTGTDPKANGLIQLACIIDIDGEIKAEKEWHIKPFPTDVIADKALEVNHIIREELSTFMSPLQARYEIEQFWGQFINRFQKGKQRHDKFYAAGFNVGFDMNVLSAYWKKCGNEYFGSFFNGFQIDPLPLLRLLDWRGDMNLPDQKLATVCRFLGIELTEAHDALADIRATRQAMLKMNSMLHIDFGEAK